MKIVLAAIILHLAGALAAAFSGERRAANRIGPAFAVAGCLVGLCGLLLGQSDTIRAAWSMPLGGVILTLDALSRVFLFPTYFIGLLCAVYGSAYMREYEGRKRLGLHWAFFNLTLAALGAVMTAADYFLFLIAWEVMSTAPFFLISFSHERAEVRRAGRNYLIAAHLGAMFLIAMFVTMGSRATGTDFASLAAASATGSSAGVFILALIGFGTKAGVAPLHVWLPEAHPAAPSHVSAFMSGALIKAGIYGLLRVITLLGPPQAWWGVILVLAGLVTAGAGILFALARYDLKRILAYSSVENIGIICIGIGVGLLAAAHGLPTAAVLGLAGALLHVLNHCIMKGLLFLSAGAVLHGAGTARIEDLGGLLKIMPWTGTAFIVGSAAISGLPPLCAFSSELLIYLAVGGSLTKMAFAPGMAMWGAVCGLAIIGGLAVAAFARAAGTAFLGEPRTILRGHAGDPSGREKGVIMFLAVSCLAAAWLAPFIFKAVLPAALLLVGPDSGVLTGVELGSTALFWTAIASFVVTGGVLLMALIRWRLLAGRPVNQVGTWDCGYLEPSARMQYTGASFAEPLTSLMSQVLGSHPESVKPQGYFPKPGRFDIRTPDWMSEAVLKPSFVALSRFFESMRPLQHGKTHLYILYILAVLIILLVWRLG